MPQKCKVILNNGAASVVEYNGTKVQFPPIKDGTEYVYVENKGSTYTIVSCTEIENKNKKQLIQKKPIQKKKELDEKAQDAGQLPEILNE